jgi:hypothetical protein
VVPLLLPLLVVPPLLVPPLLDPVVPLSGGGPPPLLLLLPPPPQGPQMPWVLPAGETQDVPGQQSALFVHLPHAAMHWVPEHTYGGVPPAVGLGTQGAPLQQLALDAHAPPADTHCAGEHRGTPTLS